MYYIITLHLQKSSGSEYCTTEWWFALIVSFPPLDAFSPFVWRHMKCVKSKLYLLWNWNVRAVAVVVVVVVTAAAVSNAVAVTVTVAIAVATEIADVIAVAVLSVVAATVTVAIAFAITIADVIAVAILAVAAVVDVAVAVATTILDDGISREDVNISNLAEQKRNGKVFRLTAHVATIETISIDFLKQKLKHLSF